jgi:methylenetetrahydrofolate reductase (NADPH)
MSSPAPDDLAVTPAIVSIAAQLLREASIEINAQDVGHLLASQQLLCPGTKMYVSHLPKQTWDATLATCQAVHAAGFNAVPHVPVRLLDDADTLDRLLRSLTESAAVDEVLLIAGDYAAARGPYSCVEQVLETGALSKHGIGKVSLAGHPEGHPKVSLAEIRRAELAKVSMAQVHGMETTLITQFFFEHQPFLTWVEGLRASHVAARIIGGIAGPARIATLFKFALRCGVGPSIRALGARPTSMMKLVGDYEPADVIGPLAQARHAAMPGSDFTGLHIFCFGGFLRTCEWLSRSY